MLLVLMVGCAVLVVYATIGALLVLAVWCVLGGTLELIYRGLRVLHKC